jgi:hypothetical protein
LTPKRLIRDVSDWTEIATKKLFDQEIRIENETKSEYPSKIESDHINFFDFLQRNLHLISPNFHDTPTLNDEINEEFISYLLLYFKF